MENCTYRLYNDEFTPEVIDWLANQFDVIDVTPRVTTIAIYHNCYAVIQQIANLQYQQDDELIAWYQRNIIYNLH